jgi:hypothetical protein
MSSAAVLLSLALASAPLTPSDAPDASATPATGAEPARASPAVGRAEGGAVAALKVIPASLRGGAGAEAGRGVPVRIESSPAGARVLVDGLEAGAAPLDLTLSSGQHEVRAELEGHQAAAVSFSVQPGEAAEWRPVLARQSAGPSADAAPAPAGEPPPEAVAGGAVAPAAPEGPAQPQAQAQAQTQVEAPVAAPAAARGSDFTRWGVSLDAGLPDALGVSVLFRPLPFLRLHGGMATNTIGFAARAGAGVAFYFPITPTLDVDVGHYFPADYAAGLASRGVAVPAPFDVLVRGAGYTWASAMAGLELGWQRHFSLFVRAGVSYLQTSVPLASAANDPTLTASDTVIRATLPSAKVGFLIYFL